MNTRDYGKGLSEHYNLFPLLNDEEYLTLLIANNCGATIEREKVSSLFAIKNTSKRQLFNTWKSKKRNILSFFGLTSFTLYKNENGCIVLLYYKDVIDEYLSRQDTKNFLYERGYTNGSFFKELRHRYRTECPHEIGIFLGYPIDDVRYFIEYPDKPAIIVKYWKVYSKPEEAIKTFKRYDIAKQRAVSKTMRVLFCNKLLPFRSSCLSTA